MSSVIVSGVVGLSFGTLISCWSAVISLVHGYSFPLKEIFFLPGAYQTTATGSNLPASLSPQAEQILNSYNIVVTKDFTQ